MSSIFTLPLPYFHTIMETYKQQQNDEAYLKQLSKIAGFHISTLNQAELYCLGATREIVEADKFSSSHYRLMIIGQQTKKYR